MKKSKFQKRRRQFVDRKVQGALLLHLVSHWGLFLFAGALVTVLAECLTSNPVDAMNRLPAKYGPTVLALLAVSPIFLFDLCCLSNRFAGPIYRLRRSMKALADGEHVEPVKLRAKDYWQDLADDFNRVLERQEQALTSAERTQSADDREPVQV